MKLSICIDALFPGNFLEGLKTAAACGYRRYEFWGWQDKDLPAIRQEADRLGLQAAACCVPFIPLTDPGQREGFIEGVRCSLKALQAVGANLLIAQTGPDTGAPRPEQHRAIVEGLKAAAPLLEAAQAMLVIEPLKLRDHAGYYLSDSEEAFDIVEETASPAVKVLFDIYHQQITQGDLIRRITENIDKIGHFHIAGNPGRHEPDEGEIAYPAIFEAIAKVGYDGGAGLEYRPKAEAKEGLLRLAQAYPQYL